MQPLNENGEEEPVYPTKFTSFGGKDFDQYDWVSFSYGWSRGLQEDPFTDEAAVSECFIATFDTITQVDFLI
jgi:hypothetical protein